MLSSVPKGLILAGLVLPADVPVKDIDLIRGGTVGRVFDGLLAATDGGGNFEQQTAITTVYDYRLGDTLLHAVSYEKGSGLTYFNMHDNENTSVKATRQFIDENGGRLIELRNNNERLITFTFEGNQYQMDPNRMFTDVGVRLNLVPYNEGAAQAVRNFAQRLIQDFGLDAPEGGMLVAVHNNTDKNFSARSYVGSSEVVEVYIVSTSDTDDFFIVTERAVFERLKAKGFNVVLQNNATVADNGSLSVYCGQNGIAYVNIEAQHGHQDVQARMLSALSR